MGVKISTLMMRIESYFCAFWVRSATFLIGRCLMTNHYHLLVETPDSNLSKGLSYLNSVYTQRFNRKHSRVGHVFQGRYKAILVEKDTYLQELSRYIILNPVRAGMVESAEQWEWSSYAVTTGLVIPPSWFD